MVSHLIFVNAYSVASRCLGWNVKFNIIYRHAHTHIVITYVFTILFNKIYCSDTMSWFEKNQVISSFISNDAFIMGEKVRKDFSIIFYLFFLLKNHFQFWHICCFINCLTWQALKAFPGNHAKTELNTWGLDNVSSNYILIIPLYNFYF